MHAWAQLPHFLAVARAGSFRAGAEALGATHATTRRQIDALEARLGVRLLVRGRRGVSLTEAGERLMAEALEAERHVAAAETRVRGLDREASGIVRLSCEPLVAHTLLAPILAGFATDNPGIEFEIEVGDRFADIAGQAADLALRIAGAAPPGSAAERLGPLRVATYASYAYAAERVARAGPGGEGLAWIGYDDGGAMARATVSPYPAARMRYLTADIDSHIELARAGAGLAVLPTWVEARYPELRRLAGTAHDTGRALWLVINADLARVTRMRRLARALSSALSALCGPDDARQG